MMMIISRLLVVLILCATIATASSFPFPFHHISHAHNNNNNNNIKQRATTREALASCTTLVCASAGNQCAYNVTTMTATVCTDANTYCGSVTCVPTLANGQTCPTSQACQSSNCVEGVCKPAQAAAGQECSTSDDCANIPCENGVCKYIANGQPCDNNNQCEASFSYCAPNNVDNTKACQPFKAHGDNCTGSTECSPLDLCMIPATGDSTQTICDTAYSRGVGGRCDDDDACNDGLTCTDSGCADLGTPSYKECDDSSNCNANEVCTCNSTIGSRICSFSKSDARFYNQQKDLLNCFTAACASNPTVICARTSCLTQYCAFSTGLADSTVADVIGFSPTCVVNAALAQARAKIPHACAAPTSTSAAARMDTGVLILGLGPFLLTLMVGLF